MPNIEVPKAWGRFGSLSRAGNVLLSHACRPRPFCLSNLALYDLRALLLAMPSCIKKGALNSTRSGPTLLLGCFREHLPKSMPSASTEGSPEIGRQEVPKRVLGWGLQYLLGSELFNPKVLESWCFFCRLQLRHE